MDELFLPNDETRSSTDNMIKMPHDMVGWPQFITEKLFNTFQLPDTVAPQFNVQAGNEEARTMTGGATLVFGQGDDDRIVFPIIIERGYMYPIDILYFRGEWMPATNDTIHSIMDEVAQYQQTDIPEGKDANPPISNASNIPIMHKTGALLPQLDLTQEQLDRVKPIMEKLSSYYGGSPCGVTPGEDKLGDVIQIRETAVPNRYEVFYTSNNMLPAKVAIVGGKELSSLLAKSYSDNKWELRDKMELLQKNKFLTIRDRPSLGAMLTSTEEKLSPVEFPCVAQVMTVDKMLVKGIAFPSLTSINNKAVPNIKFFIAPDGSYSLSTVLYCKFLGTGDIVDVPGYTPHVNERGVLIYSNDGALESTTPFTIKYVSVVNGEILVGAEFFIGGSTVFKTDPLVKKIMTVNGPDGKVTLVPENAKFIPMKKALALVDAPLPIRPESYSKLGLSKLAMTKDSVGYTIDLGQKRVGHMAKEAEADFILAAAGLDEHMAKRAFEEVEEAGRAVLYGVYQIKEASDEITKHASSDLAFKRLKVPKVNYIKVANAIVHTSIDFEKTAEDDAESVDAILGLNYYTPAHLQKMLSNVDIFERARTQLAKLLLYARLTKSADSNILRDGLFAIEDVVSQLKGMAE